jgi:hypothetical protein
MRDFYDLDGFVRWCVVVVSILVYMGYVQLHHPGSVQQAKVPDQS